MKVNTIVIGQNFEVCSEFNGMEGQITGGLEMRGCYHPITKEQYAALRYEVSWASGHIGHVAPKHLRPKRDPGFADFMTNLLKEKQPC